jgi:hypothetical protein
MDDLHLLLHHFCPMRTGLTPGTPSWKGPSRLILLQCCDIFGPRLVGLLLFPQRLKRVILIAPVVFARFVEVWVFSCKTCC